MRTLRVFRRLRVLWGRTGSWVASSRVACFFGLLGPGLIAANADNDASGIYGYSLAGAQYQYKMLWILALSTISLGVCQEMGARMAAATGKGLADVIREQYGVKITMVALLCLLVANFATTVSEFAGMLAAARLYVHPEVARLVVLPVIAYCLWYVVARGTYRRLEIILLCASSIYLLYVGSAYLARPDWGTVLKQTVFPDLSGISSLNAYVFMIINVIGTTITPWGQFYIQSSVRDKEISRSEYANTRIDVLFGAFFTNFIAAFIIVCSGATLYQAGIHNVEDAGQVAGALQPIAGSYATALFTIGLFNASCFGAIAVPLSTAYAFSESLGTESAVGKRLREAPLFIGTYSAMIATSMLVVMLFPGSLTYLIILPNIVGAVLLPVILVLTLRLVNNRKLMGDLVNGRTYNVIAWATTGLLILLSGILFFTFIFPQG